MSAQEVQEWEVLGEEGVLQNMAHGAYGQLGSDRRTRVDAWLASKRLAAERGASAKRDSREEETLRLARRASTRAWIAIAIAAISIIKDIVVAVVK